MTVVFGFMCAGFFISSVRSVRVNVQSVCTFGYIASGLASISLIALG